ncbi:MAG TPA: T9SS type A sorting domain-containing protein [Bacteroidia bacterium]|nr:T9SS type A sorting domain-containing protein [Bacteroidia bacterium]
MRTGRKLLLQLLLVFVMMAVFAPLRAQFLHWDYVDMVTDTVQSGAYSDMKIAPDGTIHISYWQRVEDKLVYAWKSPGQTNWNREYVDPTHQNGFRSSICLDAFGVPHIAYYQNHLSQIAIRYAKRVGPNNWLVESLPDIYGRGYGDYGPLGTVSSKERVQHSLELVFDENNKPQISFFDGWMNINAFPACTSASDYGFKLHQGIRVNNEWLVRSFGQVDDLHLSCNPYPQRESLPKGDRYGEYLDMLVEPDGTMDIFSMSRFNNEIIRHRTLFPYVDTVWVKTSIDSLERIFSTATIFFPQFTRFFTFEGVSASMSADGNTHLAYTTSVFYGDNFCCIDSSALAYTRISPAGDITYHDLPRGSYRNYTDIVTNGGSDSLFILYADVSNLYFVMASSADSGNTWATDTLRTGIGIGRCQLDIYGDSLYALIFDAQRESLVMYKRHLMGGAWVIDPVTFSQAKGQSMDAVFTVIGNDTLIQTAFNDGYTGELCYSEGTRSSGWNWAIQQLDAGADDVIAVSMARTVGGEPVVAYNGGSGRDLRLATRSGGLWTYEVVNAGGNPQFTDIAISTNDSIYLVYYDGNLNCLHRATRHLSGNVWAFEDIACDTTSVGLYPSLVLDANGLPHVSFYNDTDRSLYYASLNGTTRVWEIDSVNGSTSSAIGKHNSLLLDANGLPKIGYLNEQDDAILLSEMNQSGQWVHTVVDSQAISNIGRPIDMQLDQFGKLWMAYNYFSNFERTKLMHRDGALWREVGVSSAGRIANEFEFKIIGGDLFLLGKKNEIQNTGMAMLYASNGVFVEANEAVMLSHNVAIQNYPNPFSGVTTFKLEVETPEILTLNVIDLLGNKVGTVFESQRLGSGLHQFDWDAAALAPGIYLYELRSPSSRSIQKMVIAR